MMEAGEDVLTADVVNLALDRPPLELHIPSLQDHSPPSSAPMPGNVVPNVEIVIGKEEDEENDTLKADTETVESNTFSLRFTEDSPLSFTPSPSPASSPERRSSCLKRTQLATDKSPTRRVSFPEDTKLVTLSIDPIDPWKDGSAKSVAEVVSAYKELCSKLRTKPNDKLVKQLQEIEEISNHLGTTTLTRCGTLSLKGIRLDNRACESLEAIFKRVQFENLDIENCSLEEEGATAILEMVEFYQSATRLNISCNPKIGFRGWQTLCRMLRKTPCLEFLDARRTLFSDQTMPMFGRCLKADPYLRVLHLEGVYLSGRPLLILATAMKYNTILEELYLGDNELLPSDGSPLATMLGANSTLLLLDLRNNGLKDTGLTSIGNGLKAQAENGDHGLSSLVMWNNGLSHEGMFYLCDALTKTKTLKSLNLGQNRLGDLGVQRLKPGLIRNKSLKRLGLLSAKLGSEGAVALAEVLADSDRLTRIDLRENNLHVAGLMALSLALKLNRTLLRMDLDKEMRKEQGLETVQQTVLADIYNYCQRNRQLSKECLSNESSICDESESPAPDGGPPMSPDRTSSSETAKINQSSGVVASIRNLVTQEGPIKNVVGTINAVAEMTAGPNQIIALPPPNVPHLVSGRSRFTITRIFESIGSASVDVANKIATNVGLDSVAMKKLSLSLSKDDDMKLIDIRGGGSHSMPVGVPGKKGHREDMIQVSGVIATGSVSPVEASSPSKKLNNSENGLSPVTEEVVDVTVDYTPIKDEAVNSSLNLSSNEDHDHNSEEVINLNLSGENSKYMEINNKLLVDRPIPDDSSNEKAKMNIVKEKQEDLSLETGLSNFTDPEAIGNGTPDLFDDNMQSSVTGMCKLSAAVNSLEKFKQEPLAD